MKKAEFITRYGEAKYAEHVAKASAAAMLRRATPEGKAKHAETMRRRYARLHPEGVRPVEKRGLVGVADGTYQQQYNQLAEIKAKHRERAKAAYQALSPEERKALRAKRVAARNAKKAADAAYREDALVKENARQHEWRVRNRDKVNHQHDRRLALPKANRAWLAWLKQQPCLDCGAPASNNKWGKSTVGHLIPVARGGTNHACNLIAQCLSCNKRQHAKIHPRFAMVNYPEAVAFAAAYEAA